MLATAHLCLLGVRWILSGTVYSEPGSVRTMFGCPEAVLRGKDSGKPELGPNVSSPHSRGAVGFLSCWGLLGHRGSLQVSVLQGGLHSEGPRQLLPTGRPVLCLQTLELSEARSSSEMRPWGICFG